MHLRLTQSLADVLTLPRRPTLAPEHERRDIHEVDAILSSDEDLEQVMLGVGVPIGPRTASPQPRKLRTIPGMGAIWDYRHITQPNGGKITPHIYVQHIPVVRQMAGRADLDALWHVLRNQGLMVQRATDGEGNVAYYTPMGRLCYHARGANGLSVGCEHMHATTSEEWTKRQLNAAAFLVCQALEEHEVPTYMARLTSGSGTVGLRRRGQTSHKEVSAKAGYNDRSDPGPGYVFEEIRKRALHFHRHRRF